MTQMHENIVGIDAAIFMHPTTWKASGHVDNFSDPMIDNKDSKKRYRVDHLIEAHAEKLALEGKKEEEYVLLKTMDELLAKEDYEGLKFLLVLHRWVKHSEMKLWQDNSFSECASLNKWKCSFLFVPVLKKNGTNTGKKPD